MAFSKNIDRKKEKVSTQGIGLTPQELVRRQVEDRDYHVSDEDMANMIISDQLSEQEEREAGNEADKLKNNKAGTSYDVMD